MNDGLNVSTIVISDVNLYELRRISKDQDHHKFILHRREEGTQSKLSKMWMKTKILTFE